MTVRILCGDCREVMKTLDECSVDAIVTDPPYELTGARPGGRSEATRGKVMGGFMGMKWDGTGVAFDPETWRQALRVLKPGGHLLAFSGTRTYHRMVCAIEDAGFEIRDQIGWVYGSGFPKSLDVSKAIDKDQRGGMVREKLLHFAKARGIDGKWLEAHGVASAASFNDWTVGGHVPGDKNWRLVKVALGVTPEEEAAFERDVIGRRLKGIAGGTGRHAGVDGAYGFKDEHDITAPATEAARQWQGWGTALKPSHEPIVVARKPLAGTVAENVLAHGTGALNIDGCRVPTDDNLNGGAYAKQGGRGESQSLHGGSGMNQAGKTTGRDFVQPAGRWPANLIHDGSDEVLALFPDSNGSGPARTLKRGQRDGEGWGMADQPGELRDAGTGSAARFFYCAKADRADRNDGLQGLPEKPLLWSSGEQSPGTFQSPNTKRAAQNNHPTVKPTDLMRYLCRLVTPPGGIVLDPFMGSGSTLKAAELEGFSAIGIELEQAYIDIARRRIAADAPLFAEVAA